MRRIRIATLTALVIVAAGAGVTAAQGIDTNKPDNPGKSDTSAEQREAAPRAAHTQHQGIAQNIPPGLEGFASVTCPQGTVVTGGGASTSGESTYVTSSTPSGASWFATAKNTTGSNQSVTAWVICTAA
ncbi:hypothetical protein [Streptomyces flavofungini]|uniref:Secreted protein n=1 Tax=Streptomyces flavofungini TaxID=68200 RepID=A0ABS0X269_9ACTN|nr:hypothetical protein [Streptomyces flavofungini]MBJ3807279.1 hypothetical protein [Streptomyces flavofungini]GHC74015.1 hypothetical protein GCM10010349_51980 [Streptomyces flavofungini]